MFQYGYGYGFRSAQSNDPALLPFSRFGRELDLMALPEEVKEALEVHSKEFTSEEDIRSLTSELLLRR